MSTAMDIQGRQIGPGEPVYVIAEMSANHHQHYDEAVKLIHAMKEAGADAVKLQTYTPDTMTLPVDSDHFRHHQHVLWKDRHLYELYQEAFTPWEWQPRLSAVAQGLGMHLFSTPFDATAVEFLEQMNVPAYKIASYELVDIPLLRCVAKTGKPVIMSTGMASLAEIEEALQTLHAHGAPQVALLKCTSAYPAPADDMNLRTIPHMAEAFRVPVGLSDHTLGWATAVAAVALGACIVEKHFTLTRAAPGPDSGFSMEPHEFRAMVDAIRETERALGDVNYSITEREKESRRFRRSLFAVQDIRRGEAFTGENVRSIRPAAGLPPKFLDCVLGRIAARDISRGTPLSWDLIG